MASPIYEDVRTQAELNDLLRHGHWIPVGRGITEAYVMKNYPGWTWNTITHVLKAAGVFMPDHRRVPYCHPDVVRVHFNRVGAWQVDWQDGTSTAGTCPEEELVAAGTFCPVHSKSVASGVEEAAESWRATNLTGEDRAWLSKNGIFPF